MSKIKYVTRLVESYVSEEDAMEWQSATLARAREQVREMGGDRHASGLIYLAAEWNAYEAARDAYQGERHGPNRPKMPLPVEGVFWVWPAGSDPDNLDDSKAKLMYEKLPR